MKKQLVFLVLAVLVVASWHFVIKPPLDHVPPINEATKTCLITGASSGIGRAIAREMVGRGWHVIAVARHEKKLQEISRELGEKFVPYKCDVASPAMVHRVSEEIKKQNYKPTLFFLNAGTGFVEEKFKPMFETHKQTFATNYFGVISWIDEWLNFVKTLGGGTFVVTSSVSAIFAGPGAAGYGASKSAISACFKALRLQYRCDNIGFVVVMPGPVATTMLKTSSPLPFTHQPEDEAKYIVEQVFQRKKQIEPSWCYSCFTRFLSWLPDSLVMKIV